MSKSEEIKKAFEADVARRHAAGLPLEQAKVMALGQLVRDIRNGKRDADAVSALVIAEEVAHGRSRESAEAHVQALLAGKASDFARRDYGYPKGRARIQPRRSSAAVSPALEVSDQLSQWANQTAPRGVLY